MAAAIDMAAIRAWAAERAKHYAWTREAHEASPRRNCGDDDAIGYCDEAIAGIEAILDGLGMIADSEAGLRWCPSPYDPDAARDDRMEREDA
jgi:hypothetical protein